MRGTTKGARSGRGVRDGRAGIAICYAMFAKPMKINSSTIAGVLVAIMVVGFLCGLVYVVNYLLNQR